MKGFDHLPYRLDASEKVLVGVSGGIDSMVLAHWLHKRGIPMLVAHVNYQLRGLDSDGDEEFVRKWCAERNIAMVSIREKISGSVQEEARRIRYEWFDDLLRTEQLQWVLVAHQMNDQAETVLMHMMQGAGVKGLKGMVEMRKPVYRPFLNVSRLQIESYAQDEHISWREDKTNQAEYYLRNYLRNQVFPRMITVQPTVIDGLAKSALLAEEMYTVFLQYTSQLFGKIIRQNGDSWYIDMKTYADMKLPLSVLGHWLQPYGFKYEHLRKMMDEIKVGGKLIKHNHVLYKDRDQLILTPLDDADKNQYTFYDVQDVLESPFFRSEIVPVATIEKYEPSVGYFDANELTFPLLLRTWQEGDKIKPMGMIGYQKISDVLINAKIPLAEKNKVKVLKNETEILWVIPLRRSETAKITPDTKNVLILIPC